MDPQTSKVVRFMVGDDSSYSDDEMVNETYRIYFVVGDITICSFNVTAVSGCPDDINERIFHSTTPLRYTVEVKNDKGEDIVIWNGVQFLGVKSKYLYVKDDCAYRKILEYTFNVRDALISYDRRQDANVLPSGSINLIEEDHINRNEHVVRIPHETAQAGVNPNAYNNCKTKLITGIACCAIMVVAIGALYVLGKELGKLI